MKFDPEHAREVLAHYVPLFEGKAPVLELGCGRGEFLGLLAAAGVEARGVDSDEGMVEKARAEGLDVVCADAVAFLHGAAPPAPFRGAFGPQFLSHLAAQHTS